MMTRELFDQVPELYDRARPTYPAALFDDLADLVGLGVGARVLELGCGTGQATVALARRGYEVVAVELGEHLAALARQRLAAFPSVQVVHAAFEAWPLPAEPFDVVFAATSFHWLDPGLRIAKSADVLRPGGALAVVWTDHVAGGSNQFFVEVQACYEQWMPGTPPGLRQSLADDVVSHRTEFDQSSRFHRVAVRRHEQELTYTRQDYIDLLLTYSNHRALEPDARASLLACIARLIDDRHGGSVTKRYLHELTVAYRR